MILLTDEEIDKAYLEASLSIPDSPTELFDISRHHDRAIAKAQLKKVVEWGDELCPHSEVMRGVLIYHDKLRRECLTCWQALLKEIE